MAGDAPFGERDGQGPSRPSSRKSQLQSANRKQDEDEKARASRLEQEHGALFEEKARALGGVEDDETAALAARIIATRIAQKGIEYEQMAAKDVTRLVVQSVGEAYRIQDLESERAKAPGVEAARTESASADYKPAAKEVTGRTEGPPPHSSDRSAPNGPAGSPDQSPSSPAGTRGAQAAAPDNGREAGEESAKQDQARLTAQQDERARILRDHGVKLAAEFHARGVADGATLARAVDVFATNAAEQGLNSRKVGHIDRPLRPLKKMRFISKSNKGSAKACAAISTDGHQVPGPRRPLIMLAQNPTLLLRHHHGNSERQLLRRNSCDPTTKCWIVAKSASVACAAKFPMTWLSRAFRIATPFMTNRKSRSCARIGKRKRRTSKPRKPK